MFKRSYIELCPFIVMLCVFLLSAPASYAQSTVIYQDDFESGVSGWSVNDSDFAPLVTNFLGRFADGNTETSRTFTLPANTEDLVIEFDLYRFDSWDNSASFGFDRFEVEINGTQIFSLPFSNPQAARSGTTGNVDWSHTPLTGREELGFNSGQFWFDQLHRFVVTVDTPGASVELTLRADLSQTEPDESGGYDNFLVTAFTDGNVIQAVTETFVDLDGDAGGVTPSVLSSDTINGVILDPNDVTLTSISSSDPNVTLDSATGFITVAANTPTGTYTVEYEICEIIDPANCSSVTESLDVFTAAGPPSSCPAGTSQIPGTYHVVSATNHPGQNQNADRSEGAPLAEGTVETGNNSAITYFGAITMDLTGDPAILVPEGEPIDVVLASAWGTAGRAEILMSVDGTSYTSLGTTGNGGSVYGQWQSNILRYDEFIVPAGGARFLQVLQQNSGVRADGVIYDNQCQSASNPVNLSANKTVEVYDPLGLGLYAIPGNDVIYTITIDNTGTGDVDSDSLILIDNMPSEIAFYNGDIDDGGPETDPVSFQDTGGSLTFDYNMDVGFSNAAAPPANFAACTYTPVNGYDEDVTFICLNPKGIMTGQSNVSLSFRSRIL